MIILFSLLFFHPQEKYPSLYNIQEWHVLVVKTTKDRYMSYVILISLTLFVEKEASLISKNGPICRQYRNFRF